MIEFIDHIAGQGKQGRRKITHEDGTIEYAKIELADDATEDGTTINRDVMLAVQGFENKITTFGNTIVETNSNGEKLTTIFNNNGSITQIFEGEKTITKTTTFLNNQISEVIS